MEDTDDVGGIPPVIYALRKFLPKNKKTRDLHLAIANIILMYVTYSLFNMARRPFAVVTTKIIEECDAGPRKENNSWCEEKFASTSTEGFMVFLDLAFIVTYGVCLYISGFIADLYNPRYYLSTGCLMAGYFCALMGLSQTWKIRNFKFFAMALILFGAAESTGWPVALSCVTHWYTGGKRATFFGFWNTHNYLGSVLGIYIASLWADGNWGTSFFIPGGILAMMGIVLYLCMVADPKDMKELDNETKKSPLLQLSRAAKADNPTWLSSNKSISMFHAIQLPGVIEFSLCMFFSRMVGYTFLFSLPTRVSKRVSDTSEAALYLIVYVVGGSIGGVMSGVLVDWYRRTIVVCAFFLLMSIPVLALGLISDLGANTAIDKFLYFLMGLFVEAPYIVTLTSISAELGTHKMIKRNNRAISTIGGILEGTGAIGAAFGVLGMSFIDDWKNVIYIMMGIQFVATLCLIRQAYKDWKTEMEQRSVYDFFSK